MKPKLKGLTLIELLIAITVSLILVVASIPIIVRSTGREALQDQARIVASFVERARNYALHPENENARNYRVYRMSDNQRLEIERWTPDGTGYEGFGEELKLPDGYKFNDTFTSIVFYVPRGNYNGTSATQVGIEKTGINGGKIPVIIESPGTISIGEIE